MIFVPITEKSQIPIFSKFTPIMLNPYPGIRPTDRRKINDRNDRGDGRS